jgi:hypothetical protein
MVVDTQNNTVNNLAFIAIWIINIPLIIYLTYNSLPFL